MFSVVTLREGPEERPIMTDNGHPENKEQVRNWKKVV
jgi:hypothetical protein